MDFISFKKLKMFKGTDILPRMPQPPESPEGEKEDLPAKGKILNHPVFILGLSVTLLALIISYLPSRSLSVPEVGDIAAADIIAPSDLTIEDQETTAKRRISAEQSVLPVYGFNTAAFTETEGLIRRFFDFGRSRVQPPGSAPRAEALQLEILEAMGIEIDPRYLAILIKARFPKELEESLISVIGKISVQGIILSKNLFIMGEMDRGFTLLRSDGIEKTARPGEIADIKDAKARYATEVDSLDLAPRSKMLLINLGDVFLRPNISYDKKETEARRARARMSVENVYYTIKKGKVIVRKGDEVTLEGAKLIRLINLELMRKSGWFANFAGTFLLFLLLFITLWYYLKSILKYESAVKIFTMTGVTLILSLILYRLGGFLSLGLSANAGGAGWASSETYQLAFPLQLGTLLFAFLATDHLALIYAILNSLMAGYVLGPNYYPLIFSLIGGIAAIYGVKVYQRQRRTSTLKAGIFFVAPVNVISVITIHLLRDRLGGLGLLSAEALAGLLGGLLSAGLAFIILPIFETVFRFLTATKLLELTNTDLPIFRQMAVEAPGSYHHSLIVSSLAEKAAEEIKADAMLARAGGLYHDIGKLKMPEYFIENRIGRFDLHKDMTPSLSTLVITSHVKEGLEYAKKLRLPARLRDIIEQHHGSSIVRFFFQKAKEKYDPELHKIGEEDYRYPGPRPASREAGLVLLADSVEAASRSLKTPTQDSLKRLITEIFNNYLQDGQLDDCDFSLRDMRAAASSFFSILFAVYHPRVEYPGFDFEMKKERKPPSPNKANGRNHQQPAPPPPQSDKDKDAD
jgi:putative nucleotidyltransferase with HDIG domain